MGVRGARPGPDWDGVGGDSVSVASDAGVRGARASTLEERRDELGAVVSSKDTLLARFRPAKEGPALVALGPTVVASSMPLSEVLGRRERPANEGPFRGPTVGGSTCEMSSFARVRPVRPVLVSLMSSGAMRHAEEGESDGRFVSWELWV